jgi:hypothetical protein
MEAQSSGTFLRTSLPRPLGRVSRPAAPPPCAQRVQPPGRRGHTYRSAGDRRVGQREEQGADCLAQKGAPCPCTPGVTRPPRRGRPARAPGREEPRPAPQATDRPIPSIPLNRSGLRLSNVGRPSSHPLERPGSPCHVSVGHPGRALASRGRPVTGGNGPAPARWRPRTSPTKSRRLTPPGGHSLQRLIRRKCHG